MADIRIHRNQRPGPGAPGRSTPPTSAPRASSSRRAGSCRKRSQSRRPPAAGARQAFKKIKPKSLQIFSRQLATMIEAGVSVVAALVTLEEQTDDKYLQEVDRRRSLRRRERGHPLEGPRAASEGLQPAVRLDGAGG